MFCCRVGGQVGDMGTIMEANGAAALEVKDAQVRAGYT